MYRYIEIKTIEDANKNEEICAVYNDPNKNVSGTREKMKDAEKDAKKGKCRLYVWREFEAKIPMYDFEEGYKRALEEINTPMHVVIESTWNPSKCPRCNEYFDEECNDGYYTRSTALTRCEKCGQKLDWTGIY